MTLGFGGVLSFLFHGLAVLLEQVWAGLVKDGFDFPAVLEAFLEANNQGQRHVHGFALSP